MMTLSFPHFLSLSLFRSLACSFALSCRCLGFSMVVIWSPCRKKTVLIITPLFIPFACVPLRSSRYERVWDRHGWWKEGQKNAKTWNTIENRKKRIAMMQDGRGWESEGDKERGRAGEWIRKVCVVCTSHRVVLNTGVVIPYPHW